MNPTLHYRGFTIAPSLYSPARSTDWCASHIDYDGYGDNRCFYGASAEELQREVDDWHDEQPGRDVLTDAIGGLLSDTGKLVILMFVVPPAWWVMSMGIVAFLRIGGQ